MPVKIHYDDPRVVALASSDVSREALASLLVEYREILEKHNLVPPPEPDQRGNA